MTAPELGAEKNESNVSTVHRSRTLKKYSVEDDKPVAFKYGQRPFQNVICEGVEEGIRGMKAGGKRRLLVPANLAPAGVASTLPEGILLVYDVELAEVLPGYF